MTRYYQEKKREHFYKEAKKHGYRARSAYKLRQIQKKYHVISPGDVIIDLGAAPGGWCQVAKEFCGKDGLVVGIDISYIQPLQDVIFLHGDVTDKETLEIIKDTVHQKTIQVVLSDMSPNISGNYSIDHAQSIYLCEHALDVSKELLSAGGHFVCKVFVGEMIQEFIEKVKENFQNVKRFSPPASRKSSSELYIIAKSFLRIK